MVENTSTLDKQGVVDLVCFARPPPLCWGMRFSLLCICLGFRIGLRIGFRIGFRIGLRMRCRIGFEMVERFKNDPNIGDALGDSARQRQKTQYIRAMPYKKSCYFEALHPSQTLPNHSSALA